MSPKVEVIPKHDKNRFGIGLALIDGIEHTAQLWPIRMFRGRFMLDEQNKPETPEDWKAIIWHYGGPKPSRIDSVNGYISDDNLTMVVTWKEK